MEHESKDSLLTDELQKDDQNSVDIESDFCDCYA